MLIFSLHSPLQSMAFQQRVPLGQLDQVRQ
jgi:hypothetical protein